jgi:alanyl-tRNA synthetase
MSGATEPILHSLLLEVFLSVDHFYEDVERRANVSGVIRSEEESFLALLPVGCDYLESHLKQIDPNKKVLAGDLVFQLNDAFGFPVDLTAQICEERGVQIDMDGVKAAQERHRNVSRSKVDFLCPFFCDHLV